MKVLWFSPTPSLYESKMSGHNGGGWISSLEKLLYQSADIELGVAFESTWDRQAKEIDSVNYYPIHVKTGVIDRFNRSNKIEKLIQKSLVVINDFSPDIIHLFGSEWWYGLLVNYTKIPIVIHMQGSLPSYYNARYPSGMSVWNKIFSTKTSLMQKVMAFRIDSTFHRNAVQEEGILKANHYFMGRTHWDEAIVKFYNPQANYFVCQEALRDIFIETTTKWQNKKECKIKLISTISGPLYKGMDVILKTAKLLKANSDLDFEWNICGVSRCDLFESCYQIKAESVNVKLLGTLSQGDLHAKLLESSFYIHPSYIDNSPNSVCEAQILGIPVIATNVGGVSTLIKDRITGFLVPANDPLMIASIITSTYNNTNLLSTISQNEITESTKRHNPNSIREDIIYIYNQILNSSNE